MLKKIKKTIRWVYSRPIIPILALLFILVAALLANVNDKKLYKSEIKRLNDSVLVMSSVIDSLECIHNIEDKVTKKAGEFAIRPHNEKSELTEEAVADLLIELEAWFPDIKMAQYQCESGFGVSNVAKSANNISGMKKTGRRQTTQIKNDEYKGYGKYNNWESFVIDHVLWDCSVFGCKKPTRAEYIAMLDRIYGGHGDYGQVMDKESRKYSKFFKQ